MSFWFTYFIRCKDNSLYCGVTNNIPERLKDHNAGKGAKYTRGRIPVKLVWYRPFGTKGEALLLECELKKLSKKEKENIVNFP